MYPLAKHILFCSNNQFYSCNVVYIFSVTNATLTGTHRPIGNGGSAASQSKEKLRTQKSMGPVAYGRTQNDAFEIALINDRKARYL